MREVWLTPGRFFGRLDPEGGAVRPALFAAVVLYLNLLLEELLQEIWLLEFNYGLLYAALSGLHTPKFSFDEEILPQGSALLTALALESLS